MTRVLLAAGAVALILPNCLPAQPTPVPKQLIIIEPGHFHASLLQREMYPGVSPRVEVFAPLGPEVLDYLNRVALFNARPADPTHWELDVHLSAHPLDEMLRDRRGNIVVFTGRNRGKIDRIGAALSAGLHVLADKPWIIASADLPKLEQAIQTAHQKNVAAFDIMTERFEITSELQRALVSDPEILGKLETGTAEQPAVRARSVHHVMKVVAGVPLRRPAWFFDINEYGEGLADVGTHVVDLVQWTAFPDTVLDYRKDIQVLAGKRWPLTLSKTQFQQVTGEAAFPSALQPWLHDGSFDYFCNNSVAYTLRGSHVKLDIEWKWEAPEGSGDVYEALFRGSKAHVEIRQGKPENYIPELYVVPANQASRAAVTAAVKSRLAVLGKKLPGLSMLESPNEIRIVIPQQFRVGHEAHFAQVTRQFFDYVAAPASMPEWERAGMLAKYYVSTRGVELSNQRP